MNTIVLEYEDSSYKVVAPPVEVKSCLKKICKKLELNNCEFSVSFISSIHMQKLNKEYRNIDAPTDILSFAVEDGDDVFVLPTESKRNIGDMLICLDAMKLNASYFKVSEDNELKRLLIHGLLHLTGENHETNNPSEPMLIKQEKILKELFS